jgi:hypothetical protein
MKSLAEKLEQIGTETQFMITDCNYTLKNTENREKETINRHTNEELYQLFGNICYYMNYLRELVTECPESLKHAIVFIDDMTNCLC